MLADRMQSLTGRKGERNRCGKGDSECLWHGIIVGAECREQCLVGICRMQQQGGHFAMQNIDEAEWGDMKVAPYETGF